ncbi:hypothetical protein NEUTE1DRAFT_127773 [Neurospora tetrasperma FGSC 2508]|uniref:Uncharacterized protein n=1 Tax=Neurospora tetrasperma (strain FGSC 2508 / ATCC MYA-4615 / P0657) TaxID=510951 RepID=F8MB25_NEUT8|nr:uncharacterized protein NEUTE1DRAFT_127773 [Neurospora tetrasperma FGSC 2508]EGO61044.1 hypothetical protein NEUTE1DRAFT_127773 [Neurospora tetrasperma FGSC 2508]EGZ74951.1 hypothetical protein NEUTE2DRAFT_148229 [Neurospora tetrasperma FGSC 2509]
MFDPNYSMEDQGQPVAAEQPTNTRDDDNHTAPDVDGFLLDGIPIGHHVRMQEQLRSQQRNYVRRHHVARRRQRPPSHHKVQKRPSLTSTPSTSWSMTSAARTTSATSTASAPASTSASASASTAAPVPSFQPSPLATEPAPQSASPSARHVVDKLAHELSVQNLQREALQLEAKSFVQQQQQQQPSQEQEQQQQEPLSPPTAMSLVPDPATTTTADHQSWAGIGSLEVDDGIEMDDAFELEDANLQSLLPPSFRKNDYSSSATSSIPNASSSSSGNTLESRRQRPEKRQSEHKAHTQSRSIQALVEEKVETGTQCNVRSAPLPTPSAPVLSKLDDLNVDHGFDFASMELEVDERYRDGTVDVLEEERALLESIQVRRAGSGSAGIRKHMVEGSLPLHYQLSAEAAMRCATVVRSRPRMRRRKEHGTGSVTSSVAYSTNSSPMAQPVQPSEQLPSRYVPAIPSSSYRTPP